MHHPPHPSSKHTNSNNLNVNHNQKQSHQIQPPQNQNIKYKIPKNLCQQCYQSSGRYILDCYCIICQQCYAKYHATPNNVNISSSIMAGMKEVAICPLCSRNTKGNKIDAKQQSSIKKIGHLFENVDIGMQRMLEIYKFQSQIVNRYCQYLEKQLQLFQNAVSQLVAANPNLYGYFNARVRLKKSMTQTQNHQIRSISIKPETTVKHPRDYASQVFESRRSTLQLNAPGSRIGNNMNADMSGIRQIGRNGQNNHSGNVVYKVPNINYNTAVRSSKRVSRANYDKLGPEYEEEDYYRYKRH